MNVKDLFENKELMNNIVEDIEDIPEDTEVTYEVWALSRTDCGESTEEDVLLGEFADPDMAIACAEAATLDQVKKELGYRGPKPDTAYFSIEVETVVLDPDDEDFGTMNIGTIYSCDLWVW